MFNFPEISIPNLSDYSVKGCIGKGAYAKVYLAKCRSNNKYYGIKVYLKDYMSKPHRIQNIKNEINIGIYLKHPNIIRLYYVNETQENLNIVMEYGGKTSLERLIEILPEKRIPENIAAVIFKNCLYGLHFMHKQNIYHRDIKLGNVLVTEDYNAKLIDFGFSIKGDGNFLSTYCGTPCYMSPEILMKKPYDAISADIWAMGVLLYRMVTGETPFKGKGSELRKEIMIVNYSIPGYLSESLREMLHSIFKQTPQDRPNCHQLLKNIWLQNKKG